MGCEWPELTLTEAGVSLIDCVHKTPAAAEEGIPYIAIPQMRDGRIDTTEARLVSPSDVAEWNRKANPKQYDVMLSRRCNPGETVFVPPGVQCVVGQNLVLLRSDGTRIHPPFLRWLVRGPAWQGQVRRHLNVGAVFDSLKCADIPGFRLPIPPLEEQRAIASILGALDDKIELNRRMSRTLDEMAQAIFKSRFVDFDRHPGRDPATGLPFGWTERPLDSIAVFRNGLAMQKHPPASSLDSVPVIKIAQLRSGDSVGADQASASFPPEYMVEDGDLLFSWSGSLLVDFWTGGRGALNQHLFKVEPSSGIPPWFVYYWIEEHLASLQHIAAGKATTMGHIQRGHLTGATVNWPPGSELAASDQAIRPLSVRLLTCRLQSRALSNLRDTLLPHLLSGEGWADAFRQHGLPGESTGPLREAPHSDVTRCDPDVWS